MLCWVSPISVYTSLTVLFETCLLEDEETFSAASAKRDELLSPPCYSKGSHSYSDSIQEIL